MLGHAGAALIRVYQRHLSPRKGYRCAYGVLHGAGTCSSIGLAIMEQQGFWAFWRQMPLQFDACHAAATTLNQETGEERKRRKRRARENKWDCGDCDDCDLPCSSTDIAIFEGTGSCVETDGFEFGACGSID